MSKDPITVKHAKPSIPTEHTPASRVSMPWEQPNIAEGHITAAKQFFGDGFVNTLANLGQGAENSLSASKYRQTNQLTWDRETLDAMVRQSWLVRKAIEAIAEDMTREGIEIQSQIDPSQKDKVLRSMVRMNVWDDLQSGIMWGRLYGGAAAIMLIDGQDMRTPLRPETIGKGQFKGLYVLDRWTIWPSTDKLVQTFGPDYGLPEYYNVSVGDGSILDNKWIHHSRILRFIGNKLPYWQAVRDLWWGQSVVETMFDRLVCFDTATTATAQLVDKAFIRVMKIPDLTNMLATNGQAQEALLRQIMFMRVTQGIEGITLIDSAEDIEFASYQFAGLRDVLTQLGEQLGGSIGVPMTRLFGQSPSGLSATGEYDMRNYYDFIGGKQEKDLHPIIDRLLRVIFPSVLGMPMPEDFHFIFRSLWKMSDVEKSTIGSQDITTLTTAFTAGALPLDTYLREIRHLSNISGRGTSVTDDDIDTAANIPPSSEDIPSEEEGEGISDAVLLSNYSIPGRSPVNPGMIKTTRTAGLLPDDSHTAVIGN